MNTCFCDREREASVWFPQVMDYEELDVSPVDSAIKRGKTIHPSTARLSLMKLKVQTAACASWFSQFELKHAAKLCLVYVFVASILSIYLSIYLH